MSSPSTVLGEKYKTFVGGIGAASSVQKCVFVPDYHLNLWQDGTADKVEEPFQTLAAYIASRQVMMRINSPEYRDQNGQLTISEQGIYQLRLQATTEADATAFTSIQISKALVDQINELYEKSIDDETPQGHVRTLKNNIKQIILISGLFND